jgi:hypothetical protein
MLLINDSLIIRLQLEEIWECKSWIYCHPKICWWNCCCFKLLLELRIGYFKYCKSPAGCKSAYLQSYIIKIFNLEPKSLSLLTVECYTSCRVQK